MRRILAALMTLVLLNQTKGQDLILQLDRHHSSLNFSVQYLGLMQQRGSFDKFDCVVIYDEAGSRPNSVTLVVEMGSVDTNNGVRDQHLRSPDFLNAEEFPKAVFQSDEIRKISSGRFQVSGKLRMNGFEKQIEFGLAQEYPLTIDRSKSRRVGFVGNLQINRQDFGIVGGNIHNSRFNVKDQLVGDLIDFSFSIQGIYPMGTDWPPAVAILREFEQEGLDAIVEKYGASLTKMEEDAKSVNEQEGTAAIAVMELAKVLIHTKRSKAAIELLRNLNNYENTMTMRAKLTLLEAYQLERDSLNVKDLIEKLKAYHPLNPMVLELSRSLN